MKNLTTEDTEGTEMDNGGPAFPNPSYVLKNGKEAAIPSNGMSLRDWFAGQALSGLLASGHFTLPNDEEENDGAWMTTHPSLYDENGEEKPSGSRNFDFPEAAWRCADAMLRLRKEEV